MRPSSRFVYALRALVDLALRQGTGPVTVAAIARRQEIPVRSLEQLFHRLGRKGIVQAERGPRGGYRLALAPEKIPVRMIFELFQPSSAKASERFASRAESDPARAVWREVQRAVDHSLEAVTLQALVARFRDELQAPIRHRYTFHI